MKAFVVRCEYKGGDSYEWPRIIVLGERADILVGRMFEYAESISVAESKPRPVAYEVRPFDVEEWFAILESAEWRNGFFVAIAGMLNMKESVQFERMQALAGKHCIVVVDAHESLQPGWQSAIRLPPHRSWDGQWAWGIRVVLDLMLEVALHRGLVCIDPEDICIFLEGRYSELAVAHAEGEDRAALAVKKAANALSGRVDFTHAEAFILAFHAGHDARMQEIQQGMRALRERVGNDRKDIVATLVLTDENKFAVSLIASVPIEGGL